MKTGNSSFERMEEFKYFGPNLTKQISIPGVIEGRSKSGNACCHSVQKFLSSKKYKFKIYRIFILLFSGYETWSSTLREERGLRVFENRVLRRIFGPKRAR
jgi:hypothetical protein